MEFIRVSEDGRGFEGAQSRAPFVPLGSNYCAVIERAGTGGYMGQIFPLFGADEYTEKDGVAEARRAFSRLADLGLNVIRTWHEADVFFPHGLRLDPRGAAKFDGLLGAAAEFDIRVSLGMHLCPIGSQGMSSGKIHNFEPPHDERLLEQIATMASRWGQCPEIFSWTLVGEGTLPWVTDHMKSRWPSWLEYWYDGSLDKLRDAWGPDVPLTSFADAPVPPRNVAATLPLPEAVPALLATEDAWAESTWRYDWRLFLEEIGSSAVARQARAVKAAGAKQMITVGNNCWTFPDLPAGLMGLGYNPYFYLDSVDYLCQHNYPAPQCLPGSAGDPLESDAAMQYWLTANEVMGRIYASMGKPVVLEEWGWYGGGTSSFLTPLPYRSEEDQARYSDFMMETSRSTFAGWIYWQWRDMPRAADITNFSGIYAADGNRVKPWGRKFAGWAARLKADPPLLAQATAVRPLPMKELYTSDRAHQAWWRKTIEDYQSDGPFNFEPDFERKPIMAYPALKGTPPDAGRG